MLKNAVISFLLLLIIVSCGDNKPDSANKKMSLEDVNWLEGSWQDKINTNQWEVWKKTNKGYYGRGMFIKNRDTSLFEEMTISLEDDKLIFIAVVNKNAAPVKFVSTKLKFNKIIFENPRHDFPQYISYTYNRIDQVLQAEVKGGEKGFIVQMVRR